MDSTSTAPACQAPPAPPPAPAARARLDAIRDAAIVCRTVGIAAAYRRLPGGRHEITLAEAIDAATRRRAGR
jgi:hypothetical protein